MKRILVTGAGGNASQNFVHSLRLWEKHSGQRFYIVGTDVGRYHLETSPVNRRIIVPSCSDPLYIQTLNKIVREEQIQLIHAQPDVEVAFLSKNRHLLSAPVFLPDHEVIERCHDKMTTNQSLCSKGVAAPISRAVKNPNQLADIFAEVQKDGKSRLWARAIRGAGSKAALPVISAEQAKNWFQYWIDMKNLNWSDFMLAEFLPGKEYAFQSIWHDGELISSMARERIEYMFGSIMPSGQSSSPSIAVSVHRSDVNETSERAVRAVDLRPHGVYCVDLKEDRNGVPSVTEINIGRFFTTNDFFSEAGCNMPLFYVQLALGEKIKNLDKFNAVDAGIYWIRGVDRRPTLIRDGEWSSTYPT